MDLGGLEAAIRYMSSPNIGVQRNMVGCIGAFTGDCMG